MKTSENRFFLKFCTDIEADVSAEKLKMNLESLPDMGVVDVSRSGDCADYKWRVKWDTVGGDRPTITFVSLPFLISGLQVKNIIIKRKIW